MNFPPVSLRRVSVTEVFIWSGLSYLGFAIELLGVLFSQVKGSQPRSVPPLAEYIGAAVIVFTALSPFPALYSLSKARRAMSETHSVGTRVLLWTFVLVGVFVSLVESMWTCSGHPTWLQGYHV